MKGISATVNWRPNEDWAFKYVTAKRESDTETNIDFDTTPLTLVDVRAFYSDSQVSNELQANYDGGGRARGVMGLYAFNGDAGGQVLNHFFNPFGPITLTNPLFGDTQGVVNTKSFAVYADWTFDLTNKLKLDVGARYTDEDKHARRVEPVLPRRHLRHGVGHGGQLRQDGQLQERLAQGLARLPGHRRHHGLRPGVARLQVRRLQHPRQHHGGAALGRALRRRAGRQLRDRQQDGLLRPAPVPEPGGLPQHLRGHPAVGVHVLHACPTAARASSATSPMPARARSTASRSSTSGCRASTGCSAATWPGSTRSTTSS